MDKYLISICGPTAIGKTRWAIDLANHYNTEILSADSRQFYREMRIGTAVPSSEELQAVPHHFIQHKSIQDRYTVRDFQREALERISALFKVHDHLILVGGSGLYLDAVTKGLDDFPEVAPGVREALERSYRKEGIQALQDQLFSSDPEYYKKVDLRNSRRLIRALEICISSGKPYSSYLGKVKRPEGFKHIALGVDAPRAVIYSRIDQRVDEMMKQGLLKEVRALLPHRNLSAMQTVGYQELFAHLDGETDLETAVEAIKRNTRRFAKRQGTWFRRNPDIRWIPYNASVEKGIREIEAQKGAMNES